MGFGAYLVGAQVQPELALGRGKSRQHRTVQRRAFSANVTEQFGRVRRSGHDQPPLGALSVWARYTRVTDIRKQIINIL